MLFYTFIDLGPQGGKIDRLGEKPLRPASSARRFVSASP
jgi:hypothetical protein